MNAAGGGAVMAKPSTDAQRLAKIARERAEQKWGRGWAHLSTDQTVGRGLAPISWRHPGVEDDLAVQVAVAIADAFNEEEEVQ